MNDRVMQFRVGVVVLFTLIIGALLVTLNAPAPRGWVPWASGTYEVAIELDEAPGVGPDTPVRRSGLLIGRVTAIDDLDDRLVVRAHIDEDRRLFPEYVPQVRTSVLGDATIDFVTRPVAPDSQPLADGATLRGEVVGNPLDVLASLQDDLAVTVRSLGNAGDEVARLAARVNEAFGDETEQGRVARLLDKTETAMDQFSVSMQAANDFFGDDELRQQFKQALAEAPDAVREARITMQDFRVVLRSAEENLQNMKGFTDPLGQQGEAISSAILDSVEGLERLLEEFSVLSQALNSREGTLGQLIHNPQLYDNLNRLTVNANQVLLKINEMTTRLRPVIEDARVFMDKIAREPGRVVSGGLNPSPIK